MASIVLSGCGGGDDDAASAAPVPSPAAGQSAGPVGPGGGTGAVASDAATRDAGRHDAATRDGGPRDAAIGGPDRRDAAPEAGPIDAAVDAGATSDRFGVRMLYPTIAGGREWFLPDDAEQRSDEWNVESNPVTRVSAGTFHTSGNDGEVRLSVASPSGRAWWRNVEMTGYYRYTAPMDSNDQERHWELLARGERHSSSPANGNAINGGVRAPAGTATWPGYPYGDVSLNAHCLGSSYHGNFYLDGRGLFEKEVSHSGGYASQRAAKTVPGFADPLGRWFGLKLVLQNADGDRRVHFELWLDDGASDDWVLLTQGDDTPGSWPARDEALDGCTSAPFSYQPDQLMTWAGPWLVFRSDSIALDFRWLSAREIAPLP